MDLQRIVIVDRSRLAANLYQLLFQPFQAELIFRQRLDQRFGTFLKQRQITLAIINVSTFGATEKRLLSSLFGDDAVQAVNKIFLCGESAPERRWKVQLQKLERAWVMPRPFHPDDLLGLIRKILRGER